VDHVGGRSWLHLLTGGNRFLVSAAEAFVFISGVVAGIVYGGRARRDGMGVATRQLLGRAWLLYSMAVWLALGMALAGWLFALPLATDFAADPARFALEVITLQRTFYLVDVMLLYCFVLTLAPAALWTLRRGHPWVLLLASWALWGAYQVRPRDLQLPWPIVDNVVFHLAPWQVLFFTGLALGHERERWGRAPSRLPRRRRGGWWPAALAAAFAGLVWLHATNGAALAPYLAGGDGAALLDAWFDKRALPPGRLLACAVVFAAAWALVTRLWRPIRAATGWLLLPLGQGALYAYAAHLVLALGIDIAARRTWGTNAAGGFPELGPALNAALQAGAVLALWALTRLRALQTVAAPLGQPPLRRWPVGRRHWWRPGDGLIALLLVGLLGAGFIAPVGSTPAGAPDAAAGVEPAAPAGPRPTSTVTAPRKVGGAAAGSARPGEEPPARPTTTARAGGAPPVRDRPTASPTAVGTAAAGGYLKDSEFFSQALDRTMAYGIYLPPDYDGNAKRYPVLYMLHGAGGHYSEWVNYGLAEVADEMILKRRIPPLIIVLPQGDQSYWTNHSGDDAERWGDYVAFDLVRHIDATYRTLAQPGSRAVGGLSMGGFGALQLAFNHPTIFGVVGAHSPSLRNAFEAEALFGDERDFRRVDPLVLAGWINPDDMPRLWLDVGEDDTWALRVSALHRVLRDRDLPHEYYLTPGDHDEEYWRANIDDYLRFYTSALVTQQPSR
jgi:enterochelin esterase-like enzyme